MLRKLTLFILICNAVISCTTPPTITKDTKKNRTAPANNESQKMLEITPSAIKSDSKYSVSYSNVAKNYEPDLNWVRNTQLPSTDNETAPKSAHELSEEKFHERAKRIQTGIDRGLQKQNKD